MFRFALLFMFPAMIFADTYVEHAKDMFDASDINSDGELTVAEIQKNFEAFDSNDDGLISRLEYTSYFDQIVPEFHPIAHALYDIYDVNNDNRLELHDFTNFHKLMDSNSNGEVTEDEFVRYWTVLLGELEHLHP